MYTAYYLVLKVVLTERGEKVMSGQGGHLRDLVALTHKVVKGVL